MLILKLINFDSILIKLTLLTKHFDGQGIYETFNIKHITRN